jgi:hypothetical protein
MLISRNEHLRRGVRKAIRGSEILSRYPEFITQYVNKDPGACNIMPIDLDMMADCTVLTKLNETRLSGDSYIPTISTGLPFFVPSSSSLRPGTVSPFRLDDRSSMHHASRGLPVEVEMASTSAEKDFVMDSSSEIKVEYNNQAQSEMISIECRSPSPLSSLQESKYSGYSRRSSNVTNLSTEQINLAT